MATAGSFRSVVRFIRQPTPSEMYTKTQGQKVKCKERKNKTLNLFNTVLSLPESNATGLLHVYLTLENARAKWRRNYSLVKNHTNGKKKSLI